MRNTIAVTLFLLLAPGVAWAQKVPLIAFVLLLVPMVNAALALVHAVVSCSAKAFFVHLGLVFTWLVLFWLFASFTPSDFLAWLPVYLSVGHSLLLLFLTVRGLYQKIRGASVPNL